MFVCVEVKVSNAVPAAIVAVKPKFWLTCSVPIAAHHAVKIPVS